MKSRNGEYAKQLANACKLSRAHWAVWVQQAGEEWDFSLSYALTKARKTVLLDYLADPKSSNWLTGVMKSARISSRDVGVYTGRLGCQRLFVFPNPGASALLMVGGDHLGKADENIWRVLAFNVPPATGTQSFPTASLAVPPSGETGLEAPYDPTDTLQNILATLVKLFPCDAAYLAVRSGNVFRIQVVWNYPPAMRGLDLSVRESVYLERMVANHQGAILGRAPKGAPLVAVTTSQQALSCWMLIPIIIGQRVIGHITFASVKPKAFARVDLHRLSSHVNRLAYRVENAIVFAEAARFLQQFAMLNELASAAALGVDTEEVARRVIERLRRTFNSNVAAVLLLSPDGKTLRGVGGGAVVDLLTIPVEKSLVGYVVEEGQPVRTGDVRLAPRYYVIDSHMRSELAVPLKYRGQVIGALALESIEGNAFSPQDEQLLVVIASQLAGMFENVRLNEETRERASELADSVRQLQAARETALDITSDLTLDTLLQRVVHRARELVDARGAELGLYDEKEQIVRVLVSENPWEANLGLTIPLMAGVAGQVAAFGEPIVVNDYNKWTGRLLPERHAPFKAVAGVPLKYTEPGSDRPTIIGTLTVIDDRPEKVFKKEDIALLELLAPQVAVSIRNARLYQELQERIEAQRLAEARLIRSARLAAVGEMAAGVAHELNNPLTTVIGFVELVLNDLPAESPQRTDLELVLQEAQRTRGVVRRLLDFSRPGENLRIRGDLNILLEDAYALVQHQARANGIEVHLHLEENLPRITVDPNQIKQVLLNLMHNALQAMSHGGTMTLTTGRGKRDSGAWLTIAVTDTGEGISPENLERIFEPFFTTRPPGQGTGLGLSVSYGIISSHGGTIEVESHTGKGSCFTIYLPVSED
jgi:two-component system NtrC family sensor kinase